MARNGGTFHFVKSEIRIILFYEKVEKYYDICLGVNTFIFWRYLWREDILEGNIDKQKCQLRRVIKAI